MRGYPYCKISPRRESAESLSIDTAPILLCHETCDVGNAWPHNQHSPNKEAKKRAWEPTSGSNQMFFWRMTCASTWNFVSIWEQWLLWDYIKVNPISNSPHSTPWLCTQWTKYPKLKEYKILKMLFRLTPFLMMRWCLPWVSYPFPPFLFLLDV